MVNEMKSLVFDPVPSRRLVQSFRINNILLRNIITAEDYKSSNCWEVMVCPENLRRECWAYRLNLGKECWILREKARKEFNWKNTKVYSNCKFYDYISRYIIK